MIERSMLRTHHPHLGRRTKIELDCYPLSLHHHFSMTNHPIVPGDVEERFEIHEARNGLAVLAAARPAEWRDILTVLRSFQLLERDVRAPGGQKTLIAQQLDSHFYRLGWTERKFDTRIVVDDHEHVAPTHKVDCFKNKVAVEVEWNNKDPFFDRDLSNFRLLFELRAIDVGVIITRCSELQEIFDALGKGSSYGSSTTHIGRLLPRLAGGSGGGCPVVAFGIRKTAFIAG